MPVPAHRPGCASRTGRPEEAARVIEALTDHLGPVLSDLGEQDLVNELLADLLSPRQRGHGPARQLRPYARPAGSRTRGRGRRFGN